MYVMYQVAYRFLLREKQNKKNITVSKEKKHIVKILVK